MIRGHFFTRGGIWRPFVNAVFDFPSLGRSLDVRLLVDTGADRTILAPLDARRLGIDPRRLPLGQPSTGVGGRGTTRTIDAVLSLDSFSTPLSLTVLEPPAGTTQILPIPSLLGRDIIARFALIVEQRTDRVLLLEPAEADALTLP